MALELPVYTWVQAWNSGRMECSGKLARIQFSSTVNSINQGNLTWMF